MKELLCLTLIAVFLTAGILSTTVAQSPTAKNLSAAPVDKVTAAAPVHKVTVATTTKPKTAAAPKTTTAAAPKTTTAAAPKTTTAAAPKTTTTAAAPKTTTTVAPPKTTTTVAPPKTTVAPPKTTVAPPKTTAAPKAGNFVFKNCAALSAAISLTGKSESVNVPAESVVSGFCGKTDANLTISWNNNSIAFSFFDLDGTVYLSEVTIKLPKTSEKKDFKMKLSANETFYSCPETVLQLKDYNVSLVSLKVQVFNYNTTYSGTGEYCGAVTTAVPTTPVPSTPKPTPAPSPITVNYTVHGSPNGTSVICLLMDAAIEFKIPYEGKKKNETYNGVIAKTPIYNGSCTSTIDTLTITTGAVTLEFLFKDRSNHYSISELKLTADTKDFKDGKAGKIVANYTSTKDFNLKVGEYYFCKSKTTLHLSSNVDVFITNLKLEAFRESNTTTTDGKMVLCPGDQKTNSIVPIAVGAALAGLVVVVLIAYLIGRKRSRKGYESV